MAGIEGSRVVITGATCGIGREVAARLASQGAHVVLACRDLVRGEEVAAAIDAATEAGRATAMTVDVSDPASIAAFARGYRAVHGSPDILVNNAGVLLADRQTTADGIERTFATNVLGYYRMTVALLDALRAAASSRVVNVTSTFAYGVDLDDLQFAHREYDGMTAYAQSKACDRMLTWALSRRLEAESVSVNAMAPGLVLDTQLYRHLTAEAKRALEQYGSRSIAEGADTAVWLASSPEVEGVTGRLFEQRTEIPCELRDEAAEERLLQICDQLARRLEPQH